MLPASQPIHGPVVATASIGNISSPLTQVVISSATAVAVYIGVRWDGDKVRGVRMELSDGTVQQAGGFDDAEYPMTMYHFAPGEKTLESMVARFRLRLPQCAPDPVHTSKGGRFYAGAGGFDNEVSLSVEFAFLVGFHAWANPDNFINGLAFMVRVDPPSHAGPITPPPPPIV